MRWCNDCDESVYYHGDVPGWFHIADLGQRPPCAYGDGVIPDSVITHNPAAVRTEP
jgi:hypothetical protein